jgi:transposase
MEYHLPLTDEQWAKLEPLIPSPKSVSTHGRPSIDECLVLDELKDLASRVTLFIFTLHMHVEPAHAAL